MPINADTFESAGYYLQEALCEAGISSRLKEHLEAGCNWITVEFDSTSEILISNTDSDVDHDPAQHGGWVAHHYHNAADDEFTPVYQTGIRDFTTDTAAVVSAVQRYRNDPSPWTEEGYEALCGPYVTAGEHLRRALAAAGIEAHNLGSTGPNAYVTVAAPHGGGILIADRNGAVDHPFETHTGWTATYSPNYVDTTSAKARQFYTSGSHVLTSDTAAVTAAVRAFLANPMTHLQDA